MDFIDVQWTYSIVLEQNLMLISIKSDIRIIFSAAASIMHHEGLGGGYKYKVLCPFLAISVEFQSFASISREAVFRE